MLKFDGTKYQQYLQDQYFGDAEIKDESSTNTNVLHMCAGPIVYQISKEQVDFVDWMPTVTPLPNVQPFIKGFIYLRGRVLLTIDLSVVVNVHDAKMQNKKRVIGLKNLDIAILSRLASIEEIQSLRHESFSQIMTKELASVIKLV